MGVAPPVVQGDAGQRQADHSREQRLQAWERLPAPVSASSSSKTSRSSGSTLADATEAARAMKELFDKIGAMLSPHLLPVLDRLRPWNEFFIFEVPDGGLALQGHIEENLSYFQANYLLAAAVVFFIAILVHPPWLVAVVVTFVAWVSYVLQGGLDPTWKPVVWGVELMSSHRLILMYVGSLDLLFLVVGETLLVLVGALSTLTATHATLHP